jgi:hypothetical protein
MKRLAARMLPSTDDARHGALAGLGGGAAFAATMLLDMRVSGERVNDFHLLGGLGPAPQLWKVTGPLMHAVNSATLGVVYAACEPHLRGPGWMRGVTFALAENTLLWPIVLLLDRVHPAVQSGELPTFNRRWPFIAENLRHLAYGLILGAIFARSRRHN